MSFDELGKLQYQPWAEDSRSPLQGFCKESWRHPRVVSDFHWIWPERSKDPGHVDRTNLILDEAGRVHSAVTEAREDEFDPPDVCSQFVAGAPENRLLRILARGGMTAKAVGPRARPCFLLGGTTCQEELAMVIKQVAGKCQMQRGVLGVDPCLGGFADGPADVVEKNDHFCRVHCTPSLGAFASTLLDKLAKSLACEVGLSQAHIHQVRELLVAL